MEESDSTGQETTDTQLIEDISNLLNFALGEGAATCQVCGSSFVEGDRIVVYVYRPAGEIRYRIGHATCRHHECTPPSEYTLGVRELLVCGRVGCCTDVATQSSWRVLLDPSVVAVSAAGTASARRVSGNADPAPGTDASRRDATHGTPPTDRATVCTDGGTHSDAPSFTTSHLPFDLDLPDPIPPMQLPDLYIGLEIDLLAPGDGIVTDRHHASAERYEADDPQNQIAGQISLFTFSGWLHHSCERVVQTAGATAYHPAKTNADYRCATE